MIVLLLNTVSMFPDGLACFGQVREKGMDLEEWVAAKWMRLD